MKDLHYTFTCTAAPVQVEGTICGKPFYFRSRHEHWTFSVSENPNVDPVNIQLPEQGEAHGYFIEARYGDKAYDASYMPLEEAGRIIERCAEMYLRHKFEGELQQELAADGAIACFSGSLVLPLGMLIARRS